MRYLIAFGGNLPVLGKSVGGNLQSAVAELERNAGRIIARSGVYRSPAFPPGAGPDYRNGALVLDSSLDAADLLAEMHKTEASHGRVRRERWGARSVDLDLIAAGSIVTPDRATWIRWYELPPERQTAERPESLILPHPRLQDRSFVLVPLMEIAPEWRHPVLGRTVAEMHADLTEEDRRSVVLLGDPGCQ